MKFKVSLDNVTSFHYILISDLSAMKKLTFTMLFVLLTQNVSVNISMLDQP